MFDCGNCHNWKDLIFLVLVQNASDSLVMPGCCGCVGHRALNQCDFFWLKTDYCGCPCLSQTFGSTCTHKVYRSWHHASAAYPHCSPGNPSISRSDLTSLIIRSTLPSVCYQMLHQCFTNVTPMLHQCYTNVFEVFPRQWRVGLNRVKYI